MKARMARRSTKPLDSTKILRARTRWLAIHTTRADCTTPMATMATNSTTTRRDFTLWARILVGSTQCRVAATPTCSKAADGETLEMLQTMGGKIPTARATMGGRASLLLGRTPLCRRHCVGKSLGRRPCCRHFTRWPPYLLSALLLFLVSGQTRAKRIPGTRLLPNLSLVSLSPWARHAPCCCRHPRSAPHWLWSRPWSRTSWSLHRSQSYPPLSNHHLPPAIRRAILIIFVKCE